jgi:NADPH-dependent ferric siderophore reductase
VQDAAERQELRSAAEVEVIWVERNGGQQDLMSCVRELHVPQGRLYAWIATESKVSRQLRRVLLDEHKLNEEFVKAAGYWRLDNNEED